MRAENPFYGKIASLFLERTTMGINMVSMLRKLLFVCACLALAPFLRAGGYEIAGVVDVSTNDTTLLISYTDKKIPHFEYYGKKLNSPGDFIGKGGMTPPEMGEENPLYSGRGGKNFLEPALAVVHSDGDLNTELLFEGAEKSVSKDGNVQTTVVKLKDTKHDFFVNLIFTAYMKENVISERAVIVNGQKGAVELQKFASSYISLRGREYYLTHINGAWANEANVSEDRLTRGMTTIQSRKLVRTTLSENPSFMLSLNAPLSEKSGEVVAGALVWNGNYKLDFEFDEFSNLNIISGIMPVNYALGAGEKFETPEFVFTYSSEGAGKATRNMHDWARNYGVYAGNKQRPILLNCWEGVHFDIKEDVMFEIIDDAADIGAEMFVMDDGWFGTKFPRNDEFAGLGDWAVNPRKLPRGIAPLAEHAASKGMRFGIWIEPEMVNPKSELAQAHPDWIVGAKGREKPLIRNQWLLDLSNPEVQDFVFGVFDSILKSSDKISYIKWDANRHLEQVGSAYLPADRQERFYIDYVRGLNEVYRRIREKYPDIIIQACSSGGGRVDYASLKYADEAWGSDNTSALSRIFIQYGESLIYPVKAIGAHVARSPRRNVATSMKFRSDVAMMGRFGIEMRPKNLTKEEREDLKRAVSTYKSIRDVVCDGDMYRLVSPFKDPNYAATMFVSKDKRRAVAFIFCVNENENTDRPYFKLDGLDPNKKYKVSEINADRPICMQNGKTLSGEYLMNRGVGPRFMYGLSSCVVELTAVE